MNLEELAARVQRLEDIEAIRALKMRYCAACDDNYNPDAIAACFSEDAIWDAGMFGRSVGRGEIHAYFAAAPDNISFAIHQVANPTVEVDGDSGTGQWYLLQPMVMRATNKAYWLAALYDEEYRRVDGQWLIHRLKLEIRAMTPYEKGFAVERIAEL
ncbi:MAG: nuclear transport factor 2 family protein [Gammaproteobacteria bacterium]|nr:nuclear transport factor 2 family protein [Gammaproteobacteria bacterium]NNM00777.1 nuclear transport factor 2 family protein [Gammaproteobacteria bacterium]